MIGFIRLSESGDLVSLVTFIQTMMLSSSEDGREVVKLLRDGVWKKQYVSEQKRRQDHHVTPKEPRHQTSNSRLHSGELFHRPRERTHDVAVTMCMPCSFK